MLGEFKKVCTRQNLNVRALKIPQKVKDALITASMDDEYFEATKDTCVFLGGKLTIIINMININIKIINMNNMMCVRSKSREPSPLAFTMPSSST